MAYNYKYLGIPEFRPPRGNGLVKGWELVGLPKAAESEIEFVGGTAKWGGNSPQDVCGKVQSYLSKQGLAIRPEEIEEWANLQWYHREPKRFNIHTLGVVPNGNISWAPRFWESCNNMLKDGSNWEKSVSYIAKQAEEKISGSNGCLNCFRHWSYLKGIMPYTMCESLHDARTWLWAVHNATREDLDPTPWEVIAEKYSWEKKPSQKIIKIILDLTKEGN